MPTVDDRIVSLKFDSAQFEQKVTQVMASLDKLNQSLRLQQGLDGFNNITKAANAVNLQNVANNVDKVASRFDALGAIGFSVIQKLTQGLMSAVSGFVKEDLLGPLITGGKERALSIEQAKFQFRGLGMDVDQTMALAREAVLGTAYGLSSAAKAAAQFGASGITAADQMSQSLRAIAGVAAMTGKSYDEIAYIFTSTAALGRVTNMDFQQFATRGLAADAEFAKQIGSTQAEVRQLAADGKISYQEFAAAMDKAYGAHATAANETYAGSLANLHAAMSRLGSLFYTPDLVQMRDVFNSLTPVIDKLGKESFPPLINALTWIRGVVTKDLISGLSNLNISPLAFIMESLGKSLVNIFYFFKQIAGVAKSAWDSIFPASLQVSLLIIVQAFENFTNQLKMGAKTASEVKSIFQGFFSILDIGWAIVKGILSVIGDVVKALFPAGAGFLSVAANVGDFLKRLDEMLVKSGRIRDFFERLGAILAVPASWIAKLTQEITEFFGKSKDAVGASTAFENVGKHIERLGDFWQSFLQRFQSVFDVFGKIWDYISNWFSELGDRIKAALSPDDFSGVADVINVGLLGGIALMLKNFTAGGLKVGLGGGIFGVIQSNLIAVTRTLNQMQAKIQADTIFKIAAAVGILAISLTILAGIDSKKLTTALAAVAVGMTELVSAMKILQADVKGSVGLAIISGGIVAMAFAMAILSLAIKNLSTVPWEGLAKGLIGAGVGLGIMVGAAKLLQGNSAGMISAGLGMIAMAIALRILASAVQAFATISWSDLAKGLVGVAVGLGLMTAAMKFLPASGVLSGAGFIEMAIGLRILADVVQEFGKLSWEAIGKGLLGIAGGLLAVTAAVRLMPVSLPITAAGFAIMAVGLRIMANAMAAIGAMDIAAIGKSLLGLAGAMIILVPAMNMMQGSIAGAAALFIVASALTVLANVITKLAGVGWVQFASALGMIAAVLVVLGLAALVLEPVVPALLSLGIALGIVGGAFALFGLGAMLVATAFQIMAAAGVAGTAALLQSLKMVAQALPQFAAMAALFLVNFAEEILKGMPTFIKVVRAVLEQILITIIEETPLIVAAFATLVIGACIAIQQTFPTVMETAIQLLLTFLQGIRDNIYQITTLVVEIIAAWMNALTANMPMIVASAANLIISFLTELANHMAEIVAAGLNLLVQFLLGVASGIGGIVAAVGTIIVTFINEVSNQIQRIIDAGADLIIKFIQGIGSHTLEIIKAAFQAILDFLNGLAKAIDKYSPQIRAAGLNLVRAIIEGVTGADLSDIWNWAIALPGKIKDWVISAITDLWKVGEKAAHAIWDGIKGMGSWLQTKITDFGKSILNFFGAPFGIHFSTPSDSKIMKLMGESLINSIGMGIDNSVSSIKPLINRSMIALSNQITDGINLDEKDLTSTFAKMASQLSDMGEFNPVITPVLDLSKVEAASGDIAKFMKVAPLAADASFKQATIIAATASTSATESSASASGPTEVNFNQTINAPTALSTNDIYRNTKSQLTLAKKELGIE